MKRYAVAWLMMCLIGFQSPLAPADEPPGRPEIREPSPVAKEAPDRRTGAAASGFPKFFGSDDKNILFLGDSITQAGTYVAYLETYLWEQFPERDYRLINLGLGSETASGLSEADHPFPRPCIHSRIDRVIAEAEPDLTFVCYGMNDGIYHPPSSQRRAAFRDGMTRLIDKLRAAGSQVVLMTPPPFDAQTRRLRGQELAGADAPSYGYKTPFADYDAVLEEFAHWVLQPKEGVALAIDIHSPLKRYIAQRRDADANFHYGDGIHPGAAGHFVITQTILRALGAPGAEKKPNYSALPQDDRRFAAMPRILRRHRLLSAAWRKHVGHDKPGKSNAPPLREAHDQAEEMEAHIRRILEDGS